MVELNGHTVERVVALLGDSIAARQLVLSSNWLTHNLSKINSPLTWSILPLILRSRMSETTRLSASARDILSVYRSAGTRLEKPSNS